MNITSIIRRTSLLLLMTLCCAMSVAAQQLPDIPVDPAVRIGHLDNGLTYYIRHNDKPEHRVEFYIAQKVGSILEEPRQRGLAHFLEHMAFNGTKNFPGDERGKGIVDWCESKAIKYGTNLNAYTSIDETVYNISNVPSDNEDVLDSCLLILHDWSNFILLKDSEIDKERGVIHEEWRSRNSGLMRIYTDAQSTMYPDSKYADCMPIGSIDVIDNFPYQDLRDYYNTWYHPDLQGIIIVGDVDVDKVEGKIKAMFSDIPRAEGKPERIYYPVADNDAPIVYIGSDKELSMPNIQLYFKHEATPDSLKGNMSYLVQQYVLNMVTSMLGARFDELTQSPEPPFTEASASYGGYFLSKTKDAFDVTVVCKGDGVRTALNSALTEIERMRRYGFSQSEYVRARANYLQALESAYRERANRRNANYVNDYTEHFLNAEPLISITDEYSLMTAIANQIPVEAINGVAQEQMVTDNNRAVFIAVPDADLASCPTKDEVLSMLGGMNSLDVQPYVDKVSDEPLMAAAPEGGSIVSEQSDIYGTTRLTLSNGVTVYVKPTDYQDDEILMNAVSPGGTYMYDDSEILNAHYLSQLGAIGGLGNFSQTDLTKVLAGKNASVSASVSSLRETVSGSCSPKDLETMMQLTYLTFTAPRHDDDAFQSFRNRTRTELINSEANPLSTLSDTLQAVMYGHNPRLLFMHADMVDSISYDRALSMYADRYGDATDFTFYLVGNIDLETARPLIASYLGGLPAHGRHDVTPQRNQDILPGTRVKEYAKHLQTPMATTAMIYSGTTTYSTRNSVLMNFLTQALDMDFNDEIREKESGTYGVSSYGSLNKFPSQRAVMQIIYQTAPDKKDRLNTLIDGIVSHMAQNGPTDEQMQKIKSYMLKRHADNLKENSYWLNAIDERLYTGEDFVDGYEDMVNSFTPQDVRDFATSLISQGNKVTVVLTDGDED